MSAETLRRAAALMRERAEPCDLGPWVQNGRNGIHTQVGRCVATTHSHDDDRRKCEAAHIASWHPAVALAVADLLDAQAERAEIGFSGKVYEQAYAVARAYLGGSIQVVTPAKCVTEGDCTHLAHSYEGFCYFAVPRTPRGEEVSSTHWCDHCGSECDHPTALHRGYL